MPFLSHLKNLRNNATIGRESKVFIYKHRKEMDREQPAFAAGYTNKTAKPHIIQNSQKFCKQRRHDFPRLLRAGMTVEAAIALPIMIFALYMLMFPLKLMESERAVQNTMENVAKNLSIAEYVQQIGEGFISSESKYKDTLSNLVDGMESTAAEAAVLISSDFSYMKNVEFSGQTSILSDDEDADADMITMELFYEADLPSGLFEFLPVTKSIVTNRRAWVGSAGGRGRSRYGEELDDSASAEADDDTIVYLGKTSSEVYHLDPNCHYLSNVMYSIDVSKIGDLRNESGGKYHACPSCKPGTSGTVYYMASGTAYHSSEDCKAITAYVRTAKLSELSGMRPCSYCGGTH